MVAAGAIHARLAGVTRIYPPAAGHACVHALGPVDLDLCTGEFFAVVGPSGCGKSTLLEILAGLQPPTAGTVTFAGRPVPREVSDGIGVVFQEDASFPWLTVWDNAAFGLRRNGVAAAEIRRRIVDATADLRGRHAVATQAKCGVVPHRQPREARVLLKNDPDAVRHFAADRPPLESDGAGRGLLEAGEHLKQRGLAAPGRTDNGKKLAAFELEID